MEPLVNAFSVLELDAEDDQVRALTFSKNDATASSSSRTVSISAASWIFSRKKIWFDLRPLYPHSGLDPGDPIRQACKTRKSKNEVNISGDILLGERQKQGQPDVAAEDYKLPLVWIDLEMTGLNVETDRILEIACIITNGNLTKLAEGPDLVIHQSKECLEKMGEWCQSHHAASGLTKKVLQSTISEREAEKQVIEFVKKYVGSYTPLLAGNSVYMDFLFLKKYMPDLAGLFSHVLVDVSSVKALCFRWYPRDQKKAPPKDNKHRAMDDIRESIMELKYYKENIFKKSKK